jgi:hypothetical protein
MVDLLAFLADWAGSIAARSGRAEHARAALHLCEAVKHTHAAGELLLGRESEAAPW